MAGSDPGVPRRPRAAAVVLAGGSGTRMGAELDGVPVNKVHLPLAGRPVLAWSLRTALRVPSVTRVVLVIRAEDAGTTRRLLDAEHLTGAVQVVIGGVNRQDSELAALDVLADAAGNGDIDVIAIHDGARPLAGAALWTRVIETADRVGGAIPGLPAPDVVPLPGPGVVPLDQDPPAEPLVGVQTPQAFRAGPLVEAYRAARSAGFAGTDTSSTVEEHGDLIVEVVPGGRHNLKITYPGDVPVAERLIGNDAAIG